MKKYNLHFLITNKLRDDLNCIEELTIKSLSGKINFILNKVDTIINCAREFKIDNKSKVEYLKSRKNIHVYMNKKLYLKLKHYHGKFNLYSMALLVRMIIRIFIKMIKKYGFDKAIEILDKYKKLQKNKYRKIIIVQLCKYLGLNVDKTIELELFLEIILF